MKKKDPRIIRKTTYVWPLICITSRSQEIKKWKIGLILLRKLSDADWNLEWFELGTGLELCPCSLSVAQTQTILWGKIMRKSIPVLWWWARYISKLEFSQTNFLILWLCRKCEHGWLVVWAWVTRSVSMGRCYGWFWKPNSCCGEKLFFWRI